MGTVLKNLHSIDWLLLIPIFAIMCIGLVTNFPADGLSLDSLFFKQIIIIVLGVAIMLIGSCTSYTILRGPFVSLLLLFFGIIVLVALLFFAPEINGAKSWFVLGPIALQPVEFIKIVLIIVLARYFANRHIHIHHVRHILTSLTVTCILFLLVLAQPDFGSSIILLAIWAGMIFVSGVSKKHAIALLAIATIIASIGWQFMAQYQQERVLAFLTPFENLQSSGYNTYQSKIAIGSGELFGKGIGDGTQSKLGFLPLYESDFVFAAFAEEWGFIGINILFILYGLVGWRLLTHATKSRTNFETLYAVGVFIFIFSHVLLHVGVNTGILPVTGITLPFISYGGSHIIAESIMIAILLGMARMQFMSSSSELYATRKWV